MRPACLVVLLLVAPGTLAAQGCGAPIDAFKMGLQAEAEAQGISPETARAFLDGLAIDPSVLAADRRQGVFQRDFLDFSRRLISQARLDRGRAEAQSRDALFDRIEAEYGVPRGVLLAFWAFETDYGQVQGDYNTADALFTLAHDCRRPELFRPQIFAAMRLFDEGRFDPGTVTGAWAGEIGQVQMLPGDILENGVDADGDGEVSLKTSAADALMSGAAMLRDFGWRPDEPWLTEVAVPDDLDWSLSGLHRTLSGAEWQSLGLSPRPGSPFDAMPEDLAASLLLPMGRNGPAFLAWPNFRVYFEWNESLTYVTTAAYFATRLMGAPIYEAGNPDPGLSAEQMRLLQERLVARGHDVGGIDGILGARTRAAVRAEQARLGLPQDAWPTAELLAALR